MKRYYCTLFEKNYLSRGMALYTSLLEHAENFHLWILCMDVETFQTLSNKKLKNATLISLAEFEDEKLLDVKSGRTVGEYCWTCTPSLILYILNKNPKIDILSYLDSDLYFYSSPEPIFRELSKNSIMIVPHRFVRWSKEVADTAGIYNVSMVSFRNDKKGRTCLTWWRDRCLEWCFNRYENGLIGDQKYLDSFPKLFKGVHSLMHPGGGVASWNISQYRVWKQNDEIMINEFPLIFFHFQGLKIYRPFPFLTSVENSSYTQKGPALELIYKPYFEILHRFSKEQGFGYSKRPKTNKYILDLVNTLLSSLSEKTYFRYPKFFYDIVKFYLLKDGRFPFERKNIRPMLFDRTSNTPVDKHYLYHPAWAARIIKRIKPKKHVDISSILSFSAQLSAFIPVEFYDYRSPNIFLDNLKIGYADLANLHFEDESIKSLSCMHTLEHIGLGRYGDPINPRGDIKAMEELTRVLAKNGDLLIVVPIGKPKLVFNAHRVYSYNQIVSGFHRLKLIEFSLIPDNDKGLGMVVNATKQLADSQLYGCGCFWFKKI